VVQRLIQLSNGLAVAKPRAILSLINQRCKREGRLHDVGYLSSRDFQSGLSLAGMPRWLRDPGRSQQAGFLPVPRQGGFQFLG
jgi:hypothetical protein